MMRQTVEIFVETAADALAAGDGGADHIKLCVDRHVGGRTPPLSLVATSLERLTIPLRVLIRPRAGDFFYSAAEFAMMLESTEIARSLGASGIVVGLLRPDRTIDVERSAALIAAADPLPVTFHKAIDAAGDPFEALEALISLGVDRILTSGQAPTARAGLPNLAALDRLARGRLTVMAGGEIRLDDLPALRTAGITAVHVGSGVCQHGRTDPARVRRLVNAWRSL